jgi:hypothetical protein
VYERHVFTPKRFRESTTARRLFRACEVVTAIRSFSADLASRGIIASVYSLTK